MDWVHLRLKDRIKPGVRVLFVGINPGVRSAQTGHHFAGFSNRFWKLLSESGLVPEPITYRDDARLTEFGFGITNLIARPSPGIDDLSPAEYVDGWRVLDRKIRRYKPEVVALVGITLFRAIEPLLADELGLPRRSHGVANAGRSRAAANPGLPRRSRAAAKAGPQPAVIHGARVFVLPNPSGRNANFSYAEMLAAFVALRRSLSVPRPRRARAVGASAARAAGAAERSRRAAGRDPRTTPWPPGAAPFRTGPHTPAGSPSRDRRRTR
jgi:TDG/mug DNA glycosylase family protein